MEARDILKRPVITERSSEQMEYQKIYIRSRHTRKQNTCEASCRRSLRCKSRKSQRTELQR